MGASEWIALVALAVTVALAVFGWLGSRTVAANDNAITALQLDLKAEREKREGLRDQYEEKLEEAKKVFEDKVEKFYDKVGGRLDDLSNRERPPSLHDMHFSEQELRNQMDRLREDLRNQERAFLEFKGFCQSNFVNRQDFIRESTLLETRITSTKRTIESLDSTLQGYLQGK